jgi:hypothetical protein
VVRVLQRGRLGLHVQIVKELVGSISTYLQDGELGGANLSDGGSLFLDCFEEVGGKWVM